jgi:hypothetical protein
VQVVGNRRRDGVCVVDDHAADEADGGDAGDDQS